MERIILEEGQLLPQPEAGDNVQNTLPPLASQDLAPSWETKLQEDGQDWGLGRRGWEPRSESHI